MGKLKIILCTMAIFIISAVGCFADSSAPNGQTYKNYYHVTFTNNEECKIWSNVPLSKDESNKIVSSVDTTVYFYNLTTGYSDTYTVSANIPFTSAIKTVISGSLGGVVVPPMIAPTVGQALTQIVPQFLKQLGNYLPTCILILSMLLGVSLVPRIIHSLM